MTSVAACEMTSLPTGRMKGYSPQGATNTLGRMTTFIDESNRLHPGQLLAFEPGADLAGTHGSGKQVTLGQGAAEVFQGAELVSGFHAFHDALQLHVLAQGHQRLDDLGAGWVEVDAGDEGAVHFQFGQRQRVDLAQAGIAGAEVVQGNAAAQFAEPADRTLGLGQVLDDGGFSDFQVQTGRVFDIVDLERETQAAASWR